MATRIALYFTAQRLTAYRCKAGTLSQDAVFTATGEDGVAAFGTYVSDNPGALFYMLADIVEEDFAQESVPAVGGRDRKSLLERKLAQRYRDTSLALTQSMGIEVAGDRREERVLFSSFTNTQQFQPWLVALRSREARLVGLYSMPLVAPMIGDRLGLKQGRYLLVSVEEAGLRQTFVDGGRMRFSRLGRINQENPSAVAAMCATESARIHQFLTNMRILERDSPSLEVLVLAKGTDMATYQEYCVSNARLKFKIVDLEDLKRLTGLKSSPEGASAEVVFLHVLVGNQPRVQFAGDDLRRFFHLWRARLAIISMGAVAFAFCILMSTWKWLDIFSVGQQTQLDQEQEAAASGQYARMQANFPKTPAPGDKLQLIAKNYQTLTRQPISPEQMLVQISRALANVPQVELDRIEWSAGVRTGRTDAGKAAGAAKQPSAGNADTEVQTATISGRVNIAQKGDYRSIGIIVDQFVEGLRKEAGIEVINKRLPFDMAAENNLSGDIGSQREPEIPRFTIVISKRAGA